MSHQRLRGQSKFDRPVDRIDRFWVAVTWVRDGETGVGREARANRVKIARREHN